jgi:hypothetical protein
MGIISKQRYILTNNSMLLVFCWIKTDIFWEDKVNTAMGFSNMVTFSFFLITVLLTILISLFDMRLYDISFYEAVINIYYSEIAIGRYISFMGAIMGLVSSLIIDFRIRRSKKESNADERSQG